MRRYAWISLAVVAAWPLAALAQQTGAQQSGGGSLSQDEKLGRQLFTQSCMVCHTRPVITAGTYGPPLSRDAAGGQADVMRQVITDGTPRMPAFKYQFTPAQIDAIVAYLKTVPPAAAKSGGTAKGDVD